MPSEEILNALESLHKEIEKLEPAIKHVEMALHVTQAVKDIPQKHIDLISEIKNNDANHKAALKTLFEQELSIFSHENKRLQQITSEIQQQILLEQESLTKLKETIQSFHDRVEKINFPERLDKLDANLAGIMSAVQAIQGRLDIVERNLSDKIRDIVEYQKETRGILQNGFEQNKLTLQSIVDNAAKKQQTFTYITWALVVIAAFIMCFLKK
jgi:DNA repair exonuclease SbcCD ATPase subunit